MTPESSTFAQIVSALQAGHTAIYPTETFYALGCNACSSQGAEHVVRLKERRPDKGLPVIIGQRSQLRMLSPLLDPAVADHAVDPELVRLATSLMDAFWPGPLSLVLPARPELPALVRGQVNGCTNTVAVRHTPHPQAAALCQECGFPLVATSANRSGMDPAAEARELDPLLLHKTVFLAGSPEPGGGLPSTLVQPVRSTGAGYVCRILRQGAISPHELRAAGFPL